MDKGQIKGAAEQVQSEKKKQAEKLRDDDTLKKEGNADELDEQVDETAGRVKDEFRKQGRSTTN